MSRCGVESASEVGPSVKSFCPVDKTATPLSPPDSGDTVRRSVSILGPNRPHTLSATPACGCGAPLAGRKSLCLNILAPPSVYAGPNVVHRCVSAARCGPWLSPGIGPPCHGSFRFLGTAGYNTQVRRQVVRGGAFLDGSSHGCGVGRKGDGNHRESYSKTGEITTK